jgi:RNA polymerase-binding transcription factor DksA
MSFEDIVKADQGSQYELMEMELRYKQRVKFNKWDGKDKKCKKCGRLIEHERLKLLNAVECKRCAFGLTDEEEDDEF